MEQEIKKIPLKNWKKDRSDLAIEVLNLDESNPRIDTGGKISNTNIIKELLEEDVLKLAINISEKGFAASSILMVIEKGNKNYITVDGNRRLLAVQMLEKPKDYKIFLSDTNYQKLERAANKKHETLKNLFSIIYPSRKEADKEMALLHLSGSSIKEWKLLRQYRYFKKRITGEKLTLKDFSDQIHIDIKAVKTGLIVYMLYEIAKTNFPRIKNDKGEIIYTDNNFLVDKFRKTIVTAPEAERFFKYHFDEDKLNIIFDNKLLFLKRLKSFLHAIYDIQDTSNPLAKAAHSKEDRLTFFRSEETSFLPDKEHKKAEQTEEEAKNRGQESMFDEDETCDKSGAGLTDSSKNERSDKSPIGLFSKSKIPFKLGNRQLQKLYTELSEPNILNYPNATHDLLRSFLECSLVAYLKHDNIKKYQDCLISKKKNQKNITLTDMLDYLSKKEITIIKDENVKKTAKQLISDDSKLYSVERMNLVNHNEHWSSEKGEVKKVWEKIEPLFKVILNPKK